MYVLDESDVPRDCELVDLTGADVLIGFPASQRAQEIGIRRCRLELHRADLPLKFSRLALGLSDDLRAGVAPTGEVGVVASRDVDHGGWRTPCLIGTKGLLRG